MKKEYILLGILVVILLAAGLWIFQITSEYQRADQEYEELSEYVKEAEKRGAGSGGRETGRVGGRRERRSWQRREFYR